ncbi:MAG TPA: hypothetical protein GX498_05035, partial [Clostridiales bacterium]|nr:hypothetical protein [Clostridiales bacterium]
MDINLKDDIDIEANTNNNDDKSGDDSKITNKAKDKEKKPNFLTSTTLGTLLMMLILAVASVGSYGPLRYHILPNFTRLPDYWSMEQ